MVSIPELKDGVVFSAFMNGLQNGDFKFKLIEKNVSTMEEANRRVEKHIHVEDMCSGEWRMTKKREGGPKSAGKPEKK